MPNKFPPALPWDTFNILLDRVHQLAQKPGNAHLYRFLIFTATVAYYGSPISITLPWRWLDVGVDLIDDIERVISIETKSTLIVYNKQREHIKHIELTTLVDPDYLKIAYKAFVLAHPEYAERDILREDPVLSDYIVPSLRSGGTAQISHKSLNQLLTSTADLVGFNPADISALVFRKTWARHQYDQGGQTKKMLTEIKKHFKHKTLGHTKRFIAFASENGCPPVY